VESRFNPIMAFSAGKNRVVKIITGH